MTTATLEKINPRELVFDGKRDYYLEDKILSYIGDRIGSNKNNLYVLTDWNGKPIGMALITASWPIHSYISREMCQVYAVVDGKMYTGRSMGQGMIFRGKEIKNPTSYQKFQISTYFATRTGGK